MARPDGEKGSPHDDEHRTIHSSDSDDADFGTLDLSSSAVSGFDPYATKSKVGDALPTDMEGFIVEAELGRGAFGCVYRARDRKLDRLVAIKRPLLDRLEDRKRYISEAKKAALLEHPGIVAIYQVGETAKGEPFVVQKYVAGRTLRALMKDKEKRLSVPNVVYILRQVCLAVDAAHAKGLIHRDLKPENLLVEDDFHTYVADFGLALLEDDDPTVSMRREIAGTPVYMSPEQISMRNDWLDGRSDIWAIGVILYECLTGRLPFKGKSVSELKDEILNRPATPIHQRNPSIPPHFDRIFQKCCAKEVYNRYATVRELVTDLEAVQLSPEQYVVPAVEVSPTSTSTIGSPSTRKSSGNSTTIDPSSLVISGRGNASTITGAMLGTLLAILISVGIVVGGAAYFGLLAKNEKLETEVVPPPVDIPPLVKQKPFVVGLTGKVTHDTIQQAIDESEPGDKILIRPGRYNESLTLNKSIRLVAEPELGDSPDAKTRIIHFAESCLNISAAKSTIELDGIILESEAPIKNVIELESGHLILRKCEIYASHRQSYSCIKGDREALITASDCRFSTMSEPAIHGTSDNRIEATNCEFRIMSDATLGDKQALVYALDSSGVFEDCKFEGPGMKGIYWDGGELKCVSSKGCLFNRFESAIEAKDCELASFEGSPNAPFRITRCKFGLLVERARTVNATGFAIDGIDNNEGNSTGISFRNCRKARCGSIDVSRVYTGVSALDSTVEIDSMSCSNAQGYGLYLDCSELRSKELDCRNVGAAAIFGAVSFVRADVCRVDNSRSVAVLGFKSDFSFGSLDINSRTLGVSPIVNTERLTESDYLTNTSVALAGGSLAFESANFHDCYLGIVLDRDLVLLQKEIADFKGVSRTPSAKATLTSVDGLALRLYSKNRLPVMFLGPGVCRIGRVTSFSNDGDEMPLSVTRPEIYRSVAPRLESEGENYADFLVREKTP